MIVLLCLWVVGLKLRFHGASAAAIFVPANCHKAALWEEACYEALNSAYHRCHLDSFEVLLELVGVLDSCGSFRALF